MFRCAKHSIDGQREVTNHACRFIQATQRVLHHPSRAHPSARPGPRPPVRHDVGAGPGSVACIHRGPPCAEQPRDCRSHRPAQADRVSSDLYPGDAGLHVQGRGFAEVPPGFRRAGAGPPAAGEHEDAPAGQASHGRHCPADRLHGQPGSARPDRHRLCGFRACRRAQRVPAGYRFHLPAAGQLDGPCADSWVAAAAEAGTGELPEAA
ncbi:hypothetical protein FQZ97_934920 [compost metagenome]